MSALIKKSRFEELYNDLRAVLSYYAETTLFFNYNIASYSQTNEIFNAFWKEEAEFIYDLKKLGVKLRLPRLSQIYPEHPKSSDCSFYYYLFFDELTGFQKLKTKQICFQSDFDEDEYFELKKFARSFEKVDRKKLRKTIIKIILKIKQL